MLNEFLTFINKQNLIQPSQKVLLAVSGGMDSVVMCDLFSKAKLNFAIAHCNFGLRGEESNEDEMFVKKLSIKYKVPFYVTTFQTTDFAENEKISTQMAARILRYEWFEKIRTQHQFDYIATAHHQNDVLETVLLNLTKGTGIAGLHGIRVKNGHIIRPVLFAEKESIFDYVVENQIIWREDSSNESNKYQRNLIRNEVVPLLKQINPNLENTIQQTVERITAVEDIFEQEMEMLKKQITWSDSQAIYVNYKAIQTLSQPVIKLAELLKPYNFSYQQSQDIVEAFDKEAGKMFLTPTHTLVKDRTELVITPKNLQAFTSKTIEKNNVVVEFGDRMLNIGEFTEIEEDFVVPTAKKVACLDADKIRFPLQLRKWKEGDWFCPLGMNKKKLISDFLIDQKVPLNLKKDVYLLTSNGSIVWVIGFRIDDRFKVTEKTAKICLMEVK
ncbi:MULTISPECIES: tRNA lysidine(34) synthetase TilS [unclassified Arcicella]|uniref:tRNA lysidine(34) synthetase TilS n=1 Tax=unclassified Arcicella TaxID=2644986 RepID=UPI002859DB32|nr:MULTISPECIES: tRNA lysidine(34) synthetase TilS [unclassified Arcicella]MDR6560983.1 tRNA(Ile)-lysidine synthase [Arcicella sp. BE51]MDR6810867.1 tRNA(Ile)-lysidine synthase [Arcicella sp. BE140]MDR6822217.1 tRNA(Ile)-lysidine synthase [Arcicella sp. BE139]